MKQPNRILLIFLSLLALTLSTCEQSVGPVAISDIPDYAASTPIAVSDSIEALMIIVPMETEIADKDITMETQAYSLPAGATWSDVQSSYKENLASAGWELEKGLTDESEEPYTIGWRREYETGEQMLVVAYTSNISDAGSTLVVTLFTE